MIPGTGVLTLPCSRSFWRVQPGPASPWAPEGGVWAVLEPKPQWAFAECFWWSCEYLEHSWGKPTLGVPWEVQKHPGFEGEEGKRVVKDVIFLHFCCFKDHLLVGYQRCSQRRQSGGCQDHLHGTHSSGGRCILAPAPWIPVWICCWWSEAHDVSGGILSQTASAPQAFSSP